MQVFRGMNSSLLIFFLIVVLFLSYEVFHPHDNIYSPSIKPQDELVMRSSDSLNQALPYHEYKRMQDSIREKVYASYYESIPGSRIETLDVGLAFPGKDQDQYYLTLKSYNLDLRAFTYSLNKKNFIEYFVPNNSDKNRPESGQTVSKQIPVRIAQENEKEEWTVYFPISRPAATAFRILMLIFIVIFWIGAFCILIYLPLRFLYLVAKGKAFSDESIGSLHLIAWFLLGIGILHPLLKIIIHLIFINQIPPPVHFSFFDAIMSGWGFLISGLMVLLFAKAFLRGSQLEEDQDLTI
jgi:hypothetical protein